MARTRNRNHDSVDAGAPARARRPVRTIGAWAIAIGFSGVLAVAGAATRPMRAPAPSSAFSLSQAQRLVTGASAGHLEARRVFAGPHGLYGVVVGAKGDPHSASILWVTPDRDAILAGTLIDAAGNDLNTTAKFAMGLQFSPTESLRRASLPAARAIVTPGRGPILTAFIDPNCSYCHMLYDQIMPHVLKGELRVRFVIVGVVKSDSAQRAAAILSAPDPLAALAQDQRGFDVAREEGGYPIAKAHLAPASIAAVAANNALIAKAGIDGTPALVYCSRRKASVRMIVGMPTSLPTLLEDLSDRPASACAG
jgi:thiol:disulfide interchange protein DsbG